MLMKHEYTYVKICLGYAKDRPYILKRYMGTVVAESGISITYPLMDVHTTNNTYCIGLGETVECYNPQAIETQNKYLQTRRKGNAMVRKDTRQHHVPKTQTRKYAKTVKKRRGL